MKAIIQVKRGTAAWFAEENPVLASGEWGYEVDSDKLKIGNGQDDYLTRPYQIDNAAFVEQLLQAEAAAADAMAAAVDASNAAASVNPGQPYGVAQLNADVQLVEEQLPGRLQFDQLKTITVTPQPTDNVAALVAAAAAVVPDGGTVKVAARPELTEEEEEAGEKRIQGWRLEPTTIQCRKEVHFDFGGTPLVNYGNTGPALTFQGGYEPGFNVVDGSVEIVDMGGSAFWAGSGTSIKATRLLLHPNIDGDPRYDPSTWRRGDVVKVICDTALEGRRDEGAEDESATSRPRYGQFMTVESVDGPLVMLNGPLREVVKFGPGANVRIFKVLKNKVRISGLTLTLPEDVVDPGRRGGVRFADLIEPVIDTPHVAAVASAAYTFASCYGYTLYGATVDVARDDATVQSFGYGVYDAGSDHGRVLGGHFSRVRHAFTDDSNRISVGSNVSGYGRTYGAMVVSASAYCTTNTAWDTHLHGDSVQFIGCQAFGCYRGYQLRGIRHVIDGGTIRDAASIGIVVIDEGAAGGWSWGHTISGVNIDGCTTVFSGTVNPASHPTRPGVRENRRTIMKRINARNVTERAIFCSNMVLNASDIEIDLVGNAWSGGIVHANSSGRIVLKDFRLELGNYVPTITIFRGDTTSADIQCDWFAVRHAQPLSTAVNIAPSSAFPTAELVDAPLMHVLSTSSYINGRISSSAESIFPDGALCSWFASDGSRPSTRSITTAQFVTETFRKMMADVEAPVAVARVAISSAKPLPQLSNGRRAGQQMVIYNAANSSNITVASENSNIILPGASLFTLAPDRAMTLTWTGPATGSGSASGKWLRTA